jgi:hypothetical protein
VQQAVVQQALAQAQAAARPAVQLAHAQVQVEQRAAELR